MRSFLSVNPSRMKDLSFSGHVPHTQPTACIPCLSVFPSVTHSFSGSVRLSSHLPPLFPPTPPCPPFFRQEPCVIKQLGGAAERGMEQERKTDRKRRRGLKKLGNWGDNEENCRRKEN
ncbi:hypothetical protein AMECASPLE_034417 [Ameca splendens]|uniref:Uncharacterized protein n=1 Tax=Ameca splendens TaxID=208324 RepID=A0ABV0ZU53_9TELE